MCGITGFWDLKRSSTSDALSTTVRRMSDAIAHRGPDASGIWTDAEQGVAFGHLRLSIIDLSPTGHQPMCSADGRYVMIFNGEIYNYLALRDELAALGHHYKGHSDTEVMLAAFVEWGIKASLEKFNGMFAFAVWDRETHQLTLARDRIGEKPLYYGYFNNTLIFASELKAFRVHPAFEPSLNRDAMALYLRFNYIPTPYSIYNGVYKLPPASLLTLKDGDTLPDVQPEPYWSVYEAVMAGSQNSFDTTSETEIIDQLEALLSDAVKLRMVSDVPLGAFLSGGVDSSVVVALMQAQQSQAVQTFTIGFSEEGYNEAHYAKAVAEHLGTAHTELYLTSQEAMAIIPRLPQLYDEPFADSSQIPTFLVSQLARQKVTVSLSGDGGDELFAGYSRYNENFKRWQTIARLPAKMRQLIAQNGQSLMSPSRNARLLGSRWGRKFATSLDVLSIDSRHALYHRAMSQWKKPSQVVLNSHEPATIFTQPHTWPPIEDYIDWMSYMDMLSYLPDDILVKLDRASMGVALEGRIPLLDHRIVEFVWRLPSQLKMRDGKGKWALRQVLYRYVPENLIERPKMGFGVPIEAWLRGPLRAWAEALLDENRLQREGFFDAQIVRQKWQMFLQDSSHAHYELWILLMFQAWLENNPM